MTSCGLWSHSRGRGLSLGHLVGGGPCHWPSETETTRKFHCFCGTFVYKESLHLFLLVQKNVSFLLWFPGHWFMRHTRALTRIFTLVCHIDIFLRISVLFQRQRKRERGRITITTSPVIISTWRSKWIKIWTSVWANNWCAVLPCLIVIFVFAFRLTPCARYHYGKADRDSVSVWVWTWACDFDFHFDYDYDYEYGLSLSLSLSLSVGLSRCLVCHETDVDVTGGILEVWAYGVGCL